MKIVLRYVPPPTAEAADRPMEQRWAHYCFVYDEPQHLEPGLYRILESVGKPAIDGGHKTWKERRVKVLTPDLPPPLQGEDQDEPFELEAA